MKNIGDYIYESQVFEAEKAPDIPKKDQEQLKNIVLTTIQDFDQDAEDDWTDDELEKFVRGRFKDENWDEKVIDSLVDICQKAMKEYDKKSSKFNKDEDDEEEEDEIYEGEKWEETKKNAKEGAGKVANKVVSFFTGDEEMAKKTEEAINKPYVDKGTGQRYSTQKERDAAVKKRQDAEKERKRREERDADLEREKESHTRDKKDYDDAHDTYKIDGKRISRGEYEKRKKRLFAREINAEEKPHGYQDYEEVGKDGDKSHYLKYTDYHSKNTTDYEMQSGWQRYLETDGPTKTAIALGVAAAVGTTMAVTAHIIKKRNEKMVAGLKAKAEDETDPVKKKEFDKYYQNVLKAMYKDNGKIRLSPKMKAVPEEDRDTFEKLFAKSSKDKQLRKAGRQYIKQNGSEFLVYDAEHKDNLKDSPTHDHGSHEQTAKANDGSIIHARRKRNGRGMTYVRVKNGKEVGYATRHEFNQARRRNEGMISLKDALVESYEF